MGKVFYFRLFLPMSQIHQFLRQSSCLGFAMALTIAPLQAQALTINGFFQPSGTFVASPIGPIPFGDAPTNVTGSATLSDLFNAAADVWESVILDDHTINIQFGWTNLDLLGLTNTIAVAGTFEDESLFPPGTGFILANNNNEFPLFLDPTPTQNEEYTNFRSSVENLGGGGISTGRVWSGATGDAVGQIDLFSLLVHEIGHSLGFIAPNPAFMLPGNPALTGSSITITDPLPFAGTVIPANAFRGGHLIQADLPDALLVPSFTIGERRLITTADLLAVAQGSGFTQVDVGITQVPEPSSLLGLLGLGMAGIGAKFVKKH